MGNECDTSDKCIEERIEDLPSVQPERELELDGTESNIEILSELRAMFNCFDELEKPCYRALSDAIQALTAQPEQRWIPCSERLPEEDQYNLVTMQHANGEIDVVIARLVKPYSKNVPWEWESDDAEWTWSFGNGFAWMPLPEPYHEEMNV